MEERQRPTVSILMGMYQCADTLPGAVESILRQTFTDWELILCDDGSTDDTYQVAKKYRDRDPSRMILLKNKKNQGLPYTLNRCLGVARGKYIARMDGDDFCTTQRLEKEVRVLDKEPQIAIVSSDMGYFDASGVWGMIAHPTYPGPADFRKGTPFCHAACMVRREAYERVGGYSEDPKVLRVEDYHLWIRMYRAGYRGKNIHETLYFMRDDRKARKRRTLSSRWHEAYVRMFAVCALQLPKKDAVYAVRPLLVGMLPARMYEWLHRRNLRIGRTRMGDA